MSPDVKDETINVDKIDVVDEDKLAVTHNVKQELNGTDSQPSNDLETHLDNAKECQKNEPEISKSLPKNQVGNQLGDSKATLDKKSTLEAPPIIHVVDSEASPNKGVVCSEMQTSNDVIVSDTQHSNEDVVPEAQHNNEGVTLSETPQIDEEVASEKQHNNEGVALSETQHIDEEVASEKQHNN